MLKNKDCVISLKCLKEITSSILYIKDDRNNSFLFYELYEHYHH